MLSCCSYNDPATLSSLPSLDVSPELSILSIHSTSQIQMPCDCQELDVFADSLENGLMLLGMVILSTDYEPLVWKG